MKKSIIILFLVPIVLYSFQSDTNEEADFYVPIGWPKPIYNFDKNPLSKEKVALGRALFYDPILSKNNTISCNSCHSQFQAFAHSDHKLSHGINDAIGNRNAPALSNLAWNKFFMWDGAVHHIDAQALAPINNPLEMGEKLDDVVVKLQQSKRYPSLYRKAYGDSTISGSKTLKALSQFMLTLISANSKYDKIRRKEEGVSFTESENRGYLLFKKNCMKCHQEPLFTNNQFANNGLQPDSILKDLGRAKVTGFKKDNYLFKVPSLRNIEVTYPYMHDGRYPNLQMVLYHYTQSIHPSKTLSKELQAKIILTENDKRDIINFLTTLTDEEFLRNKKHSYPKQILRSQKE